jgi:lactate dehydrogenase-like 2-hydroxyacid dehydrogenase
VTAGPELLVVAPIPPELRARLSADYTLVDDRPAEGETRAGVEVIVTTSVAGAGEALMAALPDLKLIACNGTGLDKIDLDAAKARGITVQHTPDVVTEDTADFAIGLIYAALRRMGEAERFVRSGGWKSGRMTPSRRVYSRRLGIVGLGKIGSAIARRAAAIGMSVEYTGPREKSGVPYPYRPSVTELARAADVLVLSCPAGPATENLVDREVLSALGPEGYLVNVSRGSVVKEADLIEALETKAIAGAGLDVFNNEPAIDPRFFALENAVLQPHYAAVTAETRAAMAELLKSAIDAFYRTGSGTQAGIR